VDDGGNCFGKVIARCLKVETLAFCDIEEQKHITYRSVNNQSSPWSKTSTNASQSDGLAQHCFDSPCDLLVKDEVCGRNGRGTSTFMGVGEGKQKANDERL
jgi:hypothetical protein